MNTDDQSFFSLLPTAKFNHTFMNVILIEKKVYIMFLFHLFNKFENILIEKSHPIFLVVVVHK